LSLPVEVHEEVSGLLGDPGPVGCAVTPAEVHAAGGQFDEEQHVDPLQQHGVDGEEVTGQDRLGLCGEELLPGRPASAWRWVHPGVVGDLPNRAGRDPVAEPGQVALDPSVAPGRVLCRQPQHQQADLPVDWWATRPGVRIGPMPGDQLPVPAKQGGRGDEERRPTRPR